jgi:integrase
MPRKATGSLVYVEANTKTAAHFAARMTRADGSRFWFHFEAAPNTPKNETAFRERAAKLAQDLKQGDVRKPSKPDVHAAAVTRETVTQYVDRWMADRERAGLRRQRNEKSRMQTHVLPRIGPKPMAAVTSHDLKELVFALDEKVRADSLSGATASKVWSLVAKMFDDASASKNPALCILATNPARYPVHVKGPDKGRRRRKQWLYPKELAKLVGDERLSVRWRRIYAVASYLGLRLGELAALRWEHVDLDSGAVNVVHSYDLETCELKVPKSARGSRIVPIPAALAPVLAAMHKEAKGKGLVIQSDDPRRVTPHGLPPHRGLPGLLREHLLRAGVDRSDLHHESPSTQRVTFHDLRASYGTWLALENVPVTAIAERMGHEEIATTMQYVRMGDSVRALHLGTPFGPLPDALSAETPDSIVRNYFRRGPKGGKPRELSKPLGPVPGAGFEPTCLAASDFKSPASALPPPRRSRLQL